MAPLKTRDALLASAAVPRRRWAISLIRFSTPQQALGDSARRQYERAVAYCEANNLELVETIRDEGKSGLHGIHRKKGAFGRFVRRPRGLLAEQDAEARLRLAGITRTIAGSPALLARERETLARYTASLAELIAAEAATAPGDIRPTVAANALMGVHHALVARARAGVVAGTPHAALREQLLAQADTALALLERGLGDYAVKETDAPGR